MKTVFVAAVLSAVLTGAAASTPAAPAPALPSTPAQWKAAALRDIQAGYELTLANHAGAHDPHNPAFLGNLKSAREHAESLASGVMDGSGYAASLFAFTARIHDGHAAVYPTFELDEVKPLQWPGFIAAWRGDLFVHKAVEGAAREGERIVSCDGKPARRLMEENVFAYFGRIDEEGQWWSQARLLFTDFGNPFSARAQRCVFELAGRQVERTLDWRAAPEAIYTWNRDSISGDTLPVGVTEPRKNLLWVAMPTFHPSEQQRDAYMAIYRQVATQRERFLNADAVVVDLRANQGGSSWWSYDFAAALWGKARLERLDAARTARQETWYRTSPGNIAHVRGWAEDHGARGETEDAQRYAKQVADMTAAQAAGKPYYIKKDEAVGVADPHADQPGDPAPFQRPLYVIVSGNCTSACLDAIDYFKMFPTTKLVGAPSSADSTYMEVRVEKLPGGLAQVVLPIKLYVNRPRANGEFYRPDIPVNMLKWSTAGFLDVVEGDLARAAGGR